MLAFLVPGFLLPSVSHSQTSPATGKCPTVYITGPAGVVAPGEMVWFQASVSGANPDSLEFIWTTSSGKIDTRDGRSKIGVLLRNEPSGSSITATVEVKGFPEGCPAAASETMISCGFPLPVQIDEYSFPNAKINKAALRRAARELENNPNNQMYIFEYFPASASKSSMDRKVRQIRDYFSEIKFDISRVSISTAAAEGNMPLTKIYRVPPGSDNPQP